MVKGERSERVWGRGPWRLETCLTEERLASGAGAASRVGSLDTSPSCWKWLWSLLVVTSSRKPSLSCSGPPSACSQPSVLTLFVRSLRAGIGVSLWGSLMPGPEAGAVSLMAGRLEEGEHSRCEKERGPTGKNRFWV